jgi:hypothetical protein
MEAQNSYDYFRSAALRDEYRTLAESQDLIDPVLFQHKLLSDESIPKVARSMIANQIAPYYRPRLGVVDAPKYVTTPIEVPAFTTCEQAEDFLLQLSQREAAQELDSDSVALVSARVLDWIRSKRAGQELELKRLQADVSDQPQVIKITGGLPELPGTNVTMPPTLNGHPQTDLLPPAPKVIEHEEGP